MHLTQQITSDLQIKQRNLMTSIITCVQIGKVLTFLRQYAI